MSYLFAHRGYSGCYPENTMLAFRKAAELGCDGIELDVHLTRDGVPLITHDEDIRRVSDGRGLIQDYTLAELRRFDASGPYTGMCGCNPFPSLEEYFSYIQAFPLTTNIEIKNGEYYYEGLEKKVIDLVRAYHLEERIIFSSFNHASMVLCKRLAPDIRTGLLCGQTIGNPGAYVKSCGADFLHPEANLLTEEQIAGCEARGVGINAWTVDEPNLARFCLRRGLRSIITNQPERMLALREQYRRQLEENTNT